MTIECVDITCPVCGGTCYKAHTFEHDIAICEKCGHREIIEYEGEKCE